MNRDYFPVDSHPRPQFDDVHHDYEGMAYHAEPTPDLSRDVEQQDGIPLITSPSYQMLSPDPSYDSSAFGTKQRVSITGQSLDRPGEALPS